MKNQRARNSTHAPSCRPFKGNEIRLPEMALGSSQLSRGPEKNMPAIFLNSQLTPSRRSAKYAGKFPESKSSKQPTVAD